MGLRRRSAAAAEGAARPRRRWRRFGPLALLPLAVVALALSGVLLGREEQSPAQVQRPLPVLRLEPTDLGGGLKVTLPGYPWTIRRDRDPLLAFATGGPATVAVWRYPRRERLPRTTAELDRARTALLAALRRRDPGFRALASASTRVAGVPAVQIRARQTVLGRERIARSTHLYAGSTEIVVDAFAPPRDFADTDRKVFRLVTRSLELDAAAKRRPGSSG